MAVEIVVPEVGESIVDARVAKWLKQEGDPVDAGEAVVELETDKIDLEVAAPRKGVLASIAHRDGADVKIGDVLGTIDTDAQAATDGKGGKDVAATAKQPDQKAQPAPQDQPERKDQKEQGDRQPSRDAAKPATPSARRFAREQDVPLESVQPSGPRVTKADVERGIRPQTAAAGPQVKQPQPSVAARQPSGAPPRPAGDRAEERVRMSKRRATIARRLVEAQHTAAMLTTFNEVDMSAVMALRERAKESFKTTHGVGLGIASFFVKASIAALRAFPRLNAEIQGDEMVLKHYYDIGIAVSAAEGLVVPVLRDADRMSFAEIEQGIRGFATKAREGSLTLDDLRGGTFSITNGGVFGSLMSTPILNPPQVGILGLHAIKERPVGVSGQLVLRPMMYVALTYDHRIVDGAEAVQFLVRIKELVEDPGSMLIAS